MSRTAVDTSVIVAGLLSWHEFHAPSLRALRAAADDLVVPVPALVEAYSVLTRLPAPHRLAPDRALELIAGSFETRAVAIGLTGTDAWRLLHGLPAAGVAGGRTCDAVILACAIKGGADRLLTLDTEDFERLYTGDLEISKP